MPPHRELPDAAWQKSTWSDANGSCVEVQPIFVTDEEQG